VLKTEEQAPYGKQIVETLSRELVIQFGKSFELRNLRRMMQFAKVSPDSEIVSIVSTQLSWPHFVELLPKGLFDFVISIFFIAPNGRLRQKL